MKVVANTKDMSLLPNERFVPGFENLYKVSSDGIVTSMERNGTLGGVLKSSLDRYGYEKVVLYKNNKPHYFTVHRLVALAFIDNPQGKKTVNHINGVRTDNRVENLEWLTNLENLAHSYEYGLQINKPRKIVAIHVVTGERIEFKSQREAARALGCFQSNIHKILHKKDNVHTAKKYRFEWGE